MAGISTISYCTDQDILDIYPRISQYDYKVRLYGNWSKSGNKYTLNDFNYITDESGLSSVDRMVQLYVDGEDLGSPREDPIQVDRNGRWFISLVLPRIIYYDSANSPNDMIMELGEDTTNLLQRFRRKASRLIESYLGSTISREIMKDREGNYPTSIIQATALKTVILFISGYNPDSPDLIPLNEEYDDIMGKIKAGKIVMTGHRSSDDSKGIIRDINLTSLISIFQVFGRLKPVQLRGKYFGTEYELLKIFISSSSVKAMGAGATFSVWGKSATNLKQQLLVEDKGINGDFQNLGVDNLEVRFGGRYMTATTLDIDGDPVLYQSTAFYSDEWEIELWGDNIQPTGSQINSTTLTRSGLWH